VDKPLEQTHLEYTRTYLPSMAKRLTTAGETLYKWPLRDGELWNSGLFGPHRGMYRISLTDVFLL